MSSRLTPSEAYEVEILNKFQRDGGRPVYNILELYEDANKNFHEYQERFQPWQDPKYPDDRAYQVLCRQLLRWDQFRQWQDSNRGPQEISTTTPTLCNFKRMKGWRFPVRPSDALAIREHKKLYWTQDLFKQHMQLDLPQHTLAVKRLLEKHGFQQPFLLKEDPKDQGKLSTWVEYLAFELLCLELYSTASTKLKADYDQKWEKLVQSGFLMTSETETSVRTAKAEKERNERLNTAVRWYASAQSDPTNTLTLDMAKVHLKQVERRNISIAEFVDGSADYVEASARAARHEKIVQWIRDEIPSVVAEITDWQKDGVPGFNLKKRTRDSDAEESVGSIFKRQKPEGSRKIAPLNGFGTGLNAGSFSQNGQGQGQDESHEDACMEDI